jgi:hypothetical protein
MVYLGLYWLIDWYLKKPRRNVEEDELVGIYRVDSRRKKKRLLINEAESEISYASDHNNLYN